VRRDTGAVGGGSPHTLGDWELALTARSIIFLVSHPSAGGAQEIMANLAEGFDDRGARVRLMALYPTTRAVRATRLTWEYVYPRRPRYPWEAAGLLRAMARLLRAEQPDLVVTALPAANVLAAVGARLAGLRGRVVISHHSPAETHHRAINAVDSYAGTLGSVKTIVSVSDAVAASLDAKPADYLAKRRTIHNALPPRIEALLDALAARRAAGHAPGRRIVATGRLAEQKNYPMLIRAVALLPDVVADIVGTGPDEPALRALAAELGVAERVRFLGFRPREEALALLADGDVFVQCSLFEGHSLALIEAARLGLPIVVSDVPSQVEGVTAADGTRCGVVVPLDDVPALAAAVAALLDDPAARAAQEALSRRLAAEATYEAMIAAYEALAA
jgi:glycosyltransferase involved in cell wall biosynthesis